MRSSDHPKPPTVQKDIPLLLPGLYQQVEQAIDTLDQFDTQEYREAMEMVPGVVEEETPFKCYLRACQGNPTETAKRITRFWKYRKVLFGERWLLPMSQTGAGALNERDVLMAQCGHAHVMPRGENMGPLIIIDFSKLFYACGDDMKQNAEVVDMQKRLSVYLAVVCADLLSQGEGILMYPVTSTKRRSAGFCPELWEMIKACFPVNLAQVVIVQSFEHYKMELLEFLRESTASVVQFNTKIPALQICENSTRNTLNQLETKGIPRRLVPQALGGCLAYDDEVSRWVRERLSIETVLAPLPVQLHLDGDSQRRSTQSWNPVGARRKYTPLLRRKAEVPEEEYIVQRNRLYSRRNSQKQKLRLVSLETQKSLLENQNRVLAEQQRQLENALHLARQLVTHCESSC